MSTTTKPVNQKAWLLVLPVIICVAFSAILPLMTVVNYSVQDIISPERRVFVGTEWFAAVMRDEDLHAALWRQLTFSFAVLAVEIPLGIALALSMPAQGWKASLVLVLVALSLLIPWNVVGTIWQIYGRADIGLLGMVLQKMGFDYSYTGNALHAWITVLVMDVWHWTPLVALLCYAGLRSIPDAYYQAARIDGASKFAVFRYIQLPKMRGVLMIAVLLRFMDSFMIYTEPFVLTGGGPGNATTFLSQYLTQKAVGQFDLGPAAAFSLIYFLIILLLCFILYNWMQRVGTATKENAGEEAPLPVEDAVPHCLYCFCAVAHLLDGQHELQDQFGNPVELFLFSAGVHLGQLPDHFYRSLLVLGLYQFPDLCGHQHGDLDHGGAAGCLCVFPLQLHRRQTRVLLAVDQPHDAAGGVPVALLPALHHGGADGHPYCGGAGAFAVQRAAGGLDPGRFHERHSARN